MSQIKRKMLSTLIAQNQNARQQIVLWQALSVFIAMALKPAGS